ncbi:MAG: PQQ-binding-like beta-propeller repeat protein [Halioglobus sp.]|nr:PQQ-binding-like beta-propeller repeat protein [Halioglobus sp.]
MRRALFLTLLLPLLTVCSDTSNTGSPTAQQDTALPFLSYTSEPQPRGGQCNDTVDVNAPVIVNGFGFNHSNTRNQASLIDSTNVHTLALNYLHAPAAANEKRGAPAVTAQVIYLTSGRELLAINRLSGCQYWSFTTGEKGGNFRSGSILLVQGDETTPAVLYTADFNGYVYAIDAATGSPLWQRFVGTIPYLHFVTGGMQYHAGKLFVPVSSKEVLATVAIPGACCKSHGMLVALAAGTGELLWQYHTTGEAQESVLPGERIGPNGAPVWTTPTLDIPRNAIYIGTGQNYTEPATMTSDAIISLDMDSGEVNWIFQARANDTWNGNCSNPASLRCSVPPGHDFDFGAAPILLDDGDTLIAGDKGGVVYSIQAATGALNWSNKVSEGSTLGGIHWGMAVDQARVYVAATDFSIDKASGGLADLIPGARPGIYALDLATGAIDWEIHPTHMFEGLATPSLYSASLSVSNDLLFAASLDGVARAFDTRDGTERWSLDTAVTFTDINGVPGNGGTIDSVGIVVAGDGLLINSGYSTFQGVDGRYQAGPGNALFVLGLPP